MIAALKRALDAWRGSGPYSVTVPPADGPLRPNQAIEHAPVAVEVAAPDNLAHDGKRLLFSSGRAMYRFVPDAQATIGEPLGQFEHPIAALAVHASGVVAVGLENGGIRLLGGDCDGRTFARVNDRPIMCVTALHFTDEATLLVALGSQQNPPERWKHDLMQRNASGSVWRLNLMTGEADCLADRLAWPYGLLPERDGLIVSESWRSRLLRLRSGERPTVALSDITGYPARIGAARNGGAWLAVFAPRSQLIEFVLRERDYCDHMIREIDPRFWVAPSLSPTTLLLEPMQLGGARQLGMIKPWAPTRSYGLIVGLDAQLEPRRSFHSRANGKRHGITSCIEADGRLFATSKGSDAIVSIPFKGKT